MSRSKCGPQGMRKKALQKRLVCCGTFYRFLDRCKTCDSVVGVNRKAYYKSIHYAARVS